MPEIMKADVWKPSCFEELFVLIMKLLLFERCWRRIAGASYDSKHMVFANIFKFNDYEKMYEDICFIYDVIENKLKYMGFRY